MIKTSQHTLSPSPSPWATDRQTDRYWSSQSTTACSLGWDACLPVTDDLTELRVVVGLVCSHLDPGPVTAQYQGPRCTYWTKYSPSKHSHSGEYWICYVPEPGIWLKAITLITSFLSKDLNFFLLRCNNSLKIKNRHKYHTLVTVDENR